MKKKTKIILLVIHGLVLFVPFIMAATQLKFPVLDFETYSSYELGFEKYFPIFIGFWLLGVVSVPLCEKLNKFKGFSTYITVGGLVVFILGFGTVCGALGLGPELYPLVSETEKASNYLVFDDRVDAEFVSTLLPEKIPENAKDVEYKYFFEPCAGNYTVCASWSLPDAEYLAEKERTAGWSNGETKNSKAFCDAENGYNKTGVIEFDDMKQEIKYSVNVRLTK